MIKLLLTVTIDRDQHRSARAHKIVRPLLWPTEPAIGTLFWVSKTDVHLFYNVLQVGHKPARDCIEIMFEADSSHELMRLLEEENGGWVRDENPLSPAPLTWPEVDDYPTATVR